ncbi:rRNA maturation RNase YbeY [Burkholderiales bacterium]|nr:rRNA maturation RNase YbeY [Burkholderiales bacterium]
MSKIKLELVIQKCESWLGIPSKRDMRRWILASLLEDANVTLRLIDEMEGRELNRHFRARDKATNVLTFPYEETTPLSADIALCIPVIQREAVKQQKTFHNHFAHLCVHATLHFQDFGHEEETEREIMEGMEIDILGKMGIPNPYEYSITSNSL